MHTRAVAVLSDRLGPPGGHADRRGTRASSVLVEILARAREDTHPLDALGVYEPEVFSLVERKENATYRQAVQLLGRIRRLAHQAGEPERFEHLLGDVRADHGRKRNLVTLLDHKGW